MGRKAHLEVVVSNERRREAAAFTADLRSWRGQAYLVPIVVATMATLALAAYLAWVGLYGVAALTLVVGAFATWRLMSSLLRFLAARDAGRHADPALGPRPAP